MLYSILILQFCRTLLNSPLLRRKKSCLDSSEEHISDVLVPDKLARSKPGYQNLETFQKQKPEQRLVPLYCWQNYKILLNNIMLVVCVFNEALQRRMIN